MKANKIFWGLLFIIVGGLFLLDNFNLLSVDWTFVAKLWPLVLVFWGLAMVVGGQSPKWYTILFVVLILLLLAVMVEAFEWFKGDHLTDRELQHVQTLSEPYSEEKERATFTFEAGAGRFIMESETPQLIEAFTSTDFGRYTLERDTDDDSEHLWLRLRKGGWHWNFGRARNHVEVKLNARPVWDMDFRVGASSVDFDLSKYKIDDVRLDGGAASIRLRLGERDGESRLRLRTGVSSILIEIPSASACELFVKAPLSGKHFSDFAKVGSSTYRTNNFDTAAHRIYIDIKAGLSSLRVSRY